MPCKKANIGNREAKNISLDFILYANIPSYL